MKRQKLCEQMNGLGNSRTPFLFMVDFNQEEGWVKALDQIDPEVLLYNFRGRTNYLDEESIPREFSFSKQPLSLALYKQAFDRVQHHLHRGNSFLVNLTMPTPITTNLSLRQIFFGNRQLYRLWWQEQLVVFSPECFVRIREDKIYSYPMKGTIDAAIPNAREKILEDYKEQAEHVTIVDLIRNDLSMVSKRVKVNKFRFIDQIRTNEKELLQVSSEISGELTPDWPSRIGDLIFRLLPAGSISGAPKPKTIDIIKEAEPDSRGYYTGVMGLFDGESFDSAVMIRYIERKENQLIYRSGGGITIHSDCEKEYNELVDKVYLPIS